VLEALEQAIDKDRIILQYQVGGENFRIDMVILNKDCTAPMLAIECDGYAYHSSPQAYLYDAYRREILKTKGGFDFYGIWSTNWFHDQRNEEAKLIAIIREYDAK
jgi:very-short-patch-repair endonuclease